MYNLKYNYLKMLPKKKDSNSSSSSVEIEFEEIKNPYSVDMN